MEKNTGRRHPHNQIHVAAVLEGDGLKDVGSEGGEVAQSRVVCVHAQHDPTRCDQSQGGQLVGGQRFQSFAK